MKISICVITFNEKIHIKECLDSIFKLEFKKEDFEVLVIDGDSKDGTIDIIDEFIKVHENLKLIIEPKKGAAIARKVGVEKAKFDYIAFTDADCIVPSNWLKILSEGFLEQKNTYRNLAAVGGRNESPDDSGIFLKALTLALDTYLGSMGSTQGTIYKKNKLVFSIPTLNILYDKSALLAVGNFDEALISDAEDADINFRLVQAGYNFVFLKDSVVYHKYRPDDEAWANNMLKYGRGRAKILKKHGLAMWNVKFAIPIIFIFSFLLTPLSFISKIFILPLIYFPIILVYSIFLAFKGGNLNYAPVIYKIFVTTHFYYAFGLVRELVKINRDGQ